MTTNCISQSRIKFQRGFALLPVAIAITVIASIALLINYQSSINVSEVASNVEVSQVEYITEAGMQHALWQARNTSCAGDVTIATTTLGSGSYDATSTGGGTSTAYTLSVDQDAWIRSDDTGINNGSAIDLHIRFESGNVEQPLVRFDLSSLPTGAQINSAALWFYIEAGKEHPEGAVTIHRIIEDWTEAGVTWDSFNASYDSAVIGMIPAQADSNVWVQVNITAQVQAWVNGEPNYGVLLNSVAEGIHAEYISKEGASANHPRLEVIVGTTTLTPLTLDVTGTLTNGVVRTLNRNNVHELQPLNAEVLQPGPAESEDAEIWDQQPNNNYGDADETWVSSATNDTTRSLLRFNMDAIPAGARIMGATLSLQRQSGSSADEPVSAHRITNPWSENSVTWNRRQSGINWDTAGADFDNAAIATTLVGAAGNQRYEWDIASLVQDWVDDRYPNYGVILIAAISGMTGERFYTSDDAQIDRRPILSVTYACECNNVCLVPQGSGKVAMVIDFQGLFPGPEDQAKEQLFESWGYEVTPHDDNFLWLLNPNLYDVVYVSETADSSAVGTQLSNYSIGVVNEQGNLNDELGLAAAKANPIGSLINVVDNSHYITLPFQSGTLEIYSSNMEGLTVSGTEAPGLQTLADRSSAGTLVVLNKGMPTTGGGSAAGRRVMLPLGRATNSNFNWDYLNNNGRLLVQRALQWGTGDISMSTVNLLMVVVNPSNLTDQETAKKVQIEAWDYTVNLIDESDNQSAFDNAIATNDVVFISEDVNANSVGTKLVNANIGVVTEEVNLSDEFGLSSGIAWESGTEIGIISNAHYITSPFSIGSLTVLNTTESLAYATPSFAPDFMRVARTLSGWGVFAIDTGDSIIGGGTAAGRRVQLPWGDNDMDMAHLTADGLTIFMRSLEWAAGAELETGPLAHWKLDETTGITAVDSEGGNDGTLINGPVWNAGGQVDGALQFDEANDYVQVPDFHYGTEFTVSFGIKVDDNTGSLFQYMFSHGDINSVNSLNIFLNESSHGTDPNMLRTVIRDENDTLDNYALEFDASSIIGDGNWHTYTLTVANGVGSNVYLDGVLQNSDSRGGDAFDPTTELYLGARQDLNIDRLYGGLLDEVRIYDYVLSAEEITEISIPLELTPIAHWKLDEDSGIMAADSAGGHDGALVNSPDWRVDEGQIDGALRFDGDEDYVAVPHVDTLSLSSAFTLSAWIQLKDLEFSSFYRIISKETPGFNDSYWLSIYNSQLYVGVGGSVFNSGTSVNEDQWHHVAATFDSDAGEVRMYIDGTQAQLYLTSAILTPNSAPLLIGGNWESNKYFDGLLDDVRLYDQALTADEITTLANVGGGGGEPPPVTDCSGIYRDGFDTISFAGNNGTLNWSTDWLEINESNGPDAGDDRVMTDLGRSYVLRVRDNDGGGEGVQREADLSAYTTATLDFLYSRNSLDGASDYVTIDASSNGGSTWTEIARIEGPATDSNYLPFSKEISSFISNNTRIRFLSSSTLGNTDEVYFDNVEIEVSGCVE